jgi:mRNA-degrading endonuclease toxin of MazEF toxin-antitoxin module
MRSALVLSPAAYSARTGRAVVCLVADVPKGNPFEVELPTGLRAGGAVLADRVTSIDVRDGGVRLVCTTTGDIVGSVREKLLTLVAPG